MDRRTRHRLVSFLVACLVGCGAYAAELSGELRRWHPVDLTFDGPASSESGSPNPFLDYRLEVTFTHGSSGREVRVPGFYAADGDAASSSAWAGDKWRVHFTPDETGPWSWTASFRSGANVAVSASSSAGNPAAPIDGESGSLTVAETDKSGRDHRGKGILQYVGEHYFRFQNGELFLKGGADSPENFLGYADFDQTYDTRNCCFLHAYQPHVGDWQPGDPTWKDGKGKGIIGALNYLSSKGMNSVYFITFNVAGGDGGDVWPWTAPGERLRFDVSKLAQWDIVFSHMDRQGVQLHVLTQETENDQELDGGDLGLQRKLYYRELIARFAHHPALVWNLGEENTNTTQQRQDFANYIRDLDPYDHPIVLHTFPGSKHDVFTPLLGFANLDGPSLQSGPWSVHDETREWRDASAAAGHRWVVNSDEIAPANVGVAPDGDPDDPNHDMVRRDVLWGNLMAGGGGVEWYFGYSKPHDDLDCEDWRSRDQMWDQTRHALEFFREHLPYLEMEPCDELVSGSSYCFADAGNVYAVYLKLGGSAELTVAEGDYEIRWYDPKAGGALQDGSVSEISGPGTVSIGSAPFGGDAAALLTRADPGSGPNAVAVAVPGTTADQITLDGTSSSGAIVAYQWSKLSGPAATIANPSSATTLVTGLEQGLYAFELRVTDQQDQVDTDVVALEVDPDPADGLAVVGLTLINADTDTDIGPLEPGAVLVLAELPTSNLNVRADTSPDVVGSVRFGLDGQANYHLENAAPYALAGNTGSDYDAWTPNPGAHTLTATPYPASGANGPPGLALTVTFDVVLDGSAQPPPAPTNLHRTDAQ